MDTEATIREYLRIVDEQMTDSGSEMAHQVARYDNSFFIATFWRGSDFMTAQSMYRIPDGADLRSALRELHNGPADVLEPLNDYQIAPERPIR